MAFTPTRIPAWASFLTASRRWAGVGALGSSSRARRSQVSGHRHVHAEAMARGERLEQLQVAKNQHRLGGNRQVQPAEFRKDLEHAPGDFKLPLGRLIRIGGRAQGDGQPLVAALAKLGAQALGRVGLGVDFALKVPAVPHLHELVRVTGIAVVAAEFAAAIGVEGPGKRHAPAGLAVQGGARRQAVVLHLRPLAHQGTLGRQARNAHQRRLLRGPRSEMQPIGNLPSSGLQLVSLFVRLLSRRDLGTPALPGGGI